MIMITSKAGQHLAKAKSELDQAESEHDGDRMAIAGYDFDQAARVVANELVAQNFHQMEGD
ncbi:hypothetical protein [Chromohalobacter sp. HP20-39]|uniref:hypothetical protein n=1 Tax=Chromohalobacter sp. HP20-39 TaxID=3079306 RepID=UPI00294B6A40|nr:hypothetical protein [Chromohalobacter sp. HP20-39]MDV6318784.1 hypothetical protein [Chromohalobacter sp. HP20-39]